MRYDKGYHPAFVWGRWIVFFCIVFIFVLAMTDVVPQTLQPSILFLSLAMIVIGGAISIAGFFKSFDRGAYPIFVVILFIPVIFVIIWYFTQ